MTVATYPSAVDYTLALQHPATAFTEASLRTATFAQGLLGPYGIAGSSAVVFHATISSEDYAIRCYTRQDASTPERYAALDGFVSGNSLTKHVGIVTWYEDQVQVKGARWPVLKMGWIAGQQLNEYVGYLADTRNGGALGTLADRWLTLIGELQRVSFAHGDLQHGNILVDQQGQLRLVDFDSVWMPPLQGWEAPTESGHPSYQPAGGTPQSRWGPYMDTFSALVIYLALTALAVDPGLWPKFNNGDNLLFERADFAPALDTDIWKRLADLADPEVDRIAGKLKDCCAPGWVASKTLQDTLKATWWERKAAVPGATSPAPQVGVPGTAPTAAKTEPAAPGAPGAQAVPQPSPWYLPSVPSQAPAPAGSLPPPPTAPYQSTVAPQSGTSGGAGQPGTAGAAGVSGSWWAGQQAGTPAKPTTSAKPAAAATKTTPAKKQSPNPARTITGVLLMVAAIVVFLALAGSHHTGEGAVWGVVFFIIGIIVADPKPRKPPGNPPATGS